MKKAAVGNSLKGFVLLLVAAGSLAFAGEQMMFIHSLKQTLPPVSEPFMGFTHHFFTYTFIGKVTRKGVPCPGSTVHVKLSTEHSQSIQDVVAGPDGTYRVSAVLYGMPSETLDWEIFARTPEDKTIEVSGSYILLNGAWSTTIKKPIELASNNASI